MKRYFPLLALTLAFLGVLAWLAVRDNAGRERDSYQISVERSAPPERIVPEKRLLDINTATAEELQKLTGIGPALAQAIVDHRAEHGDFESVDGLLAVSGIGEAKLDAIRNDVTIGGGDQ